MNTQQIIFEQVLEKTIDAYLHNESIHIDVLTQSCGSDEKKLISQIITLLDYKQTAVNSKNIFIGFLGPLGAGKTTLATAITEKLGAQFIIKEPYLTNPFWKYSQTDTTYMLRSQIYFLVSNIQSDLSAIQQTGISISDTSTLTDIIMWAEWYHEIGHLNTQEFRIYNKLVTLLKPYIPRPTLLIALIPHDVQQLYQGIRQRHSAENSRIGELIFTTDDLQAQIERVKISCQKIQTHWDTKVLTIIINPQTIYTDSTEQKRIIEFIQQQLLV